MMLDIKHDTEIKFIESCHYTSIYTAEFSCQIYIQNFHFQAAIGRTVNVLLEQLDDTRSGL